MDLWEPYWKRNGKRRPLIGICEATKLYGAERVSFSTPRYEKENQCPWCGKDVNNKRRRFCSEDCSRWYQNFTVWGRGRGAYSYRILCRDNFTCQDCGSYHGVINEHGMAIPTSDGELEVHHIKHVADGGTDEPENLITLCAECHLKRHEKRAGA